MSRIRVGVIGAGMISQVEHIQNLLRLGDLFELVGVADPSKVSRQLVTDTHGIGNFETPEQLFDQKVDGFVMGSPDPMHDEQVLADLELGLHVFCEKPLCYSPA